ncbi:MAG TPA: TfoX/Sxy family protein [Pseudolabrys sp.]|nr:TfoX/Sxy family protein [Pseudolabrys sp.]
MGADYLRDLFASFGRISIQRMFSGFGLYADGTIFALVLRGTIYLKADADSIPYFEAEGLAPFGYDTKHGRRVLTSYWRMPDRLYDDPDELAKWARRALAASRNKAAERKAPRRRAKASAKARKPKAKKTKAKKLKAKRPGSARRQQAKPRGRSRT